MVLLVLDATHAVCAPIYRETTAVLMGAARTYYAWDQLSANIIPVTRESYTRPDQMSRHVYFPFRFMGISPDLYASDNIVV